MQAHMYCNLSKVADTLRRLGVVSRAVFEYYLHAVPERTQIAFVTRQHSSMSWQTDCCSVIMNNRIYNGSC